MKVVLTWKIVGDNEYIISFNGNEAGSFEGSHDGGDEGNQVLVNFYMNGK
jgi:hypothetical protein